MTLRLRRARLDDIPGILSLRDRLSVSTGGRRGGFLLGSEPEQYAIYLQYGESLALEMAGELVGFGIGLPDALLRQSDVWARRDQVEWAAPVEAWAAAPIAYLEQLAFVDTATRWAAPALAWRLVERLFEGHSHLLTTTVISPWRNAAALPLLERIGARCVGEIEEVYPRVGPLRSAIHHLDRETWLERQSDPLIARLKALVRGWEEG